MLRVRRTNSAAVLPRRSTEHSAGYDLFGLDDVYLEPQTVKLVKTGIEIEIPSGYYGKIESRSGNSLKGIGVTAGVIDSDYRGEVGVLLTNITDRALSIPKDRAIAQMIILRYESLHVVEVDKLSEPSQVHLGFGSTDNNLANVINDGMVSESTILSTRKVLMQQQEREEQNKLFTKVFNFGDDDCETDALEESLKSKLDV
jgi:dUTP pyrophosphatase